MDKTIRLQPPVDNFFLLFSCKCCMDSREMCTFTHSNKDMCVHIKVVRDFRLRIGLTKDDAWEKK